MVYLSTFALKINQMLVNIPYMGSFVIFQGTDMAHMPVIDPSSKTFLFGDCIKAGQPTPRNIRPPQKKGLMIRAY